ncbi:MAG: hypothetical protein M1820_007573 [Bogoriella megaspora]|nr:MAG: hypothetical protein M1820_007573 [Bogoriella megaspora]
MKSFPLVYAAAVTLLLGSCMAAPALEKRAVPGMETVSASGATQDKWTFVAEIKDTSQAKGPIQNFGTTTGGGSGYQKALSKAEKYYKKLAAAYPDPGTHERNGKKWINSQIIASVYWKGKGYYISSDPHGLRWAQLTGSSVRNHGQKLLHTAMDSARVAHAEEAALDDALKANPLPDSATKLPANEVYVALWGRWGGPDGETGDFEWADEEKTKAKPRTENPVGHVIHPCAEPTATKDPACQRVLNTVGAHTS